MVHSKVGDFSCRTIGFISLIHPTVLPTAEKRRYEILRKTRLERFAGIEDATVGQLAQFRPIDSIGTAGQNDIVPLEKPIDVLKTTFFRTVDRYNEPAMTSRILFRPASF